VYSIRGQNNLDINLGCPGVTRKLGQLSQNNGRNIEKFSQLYQLNRADYSSRGGLQINRQSLAYVKVHLSSWSVTRSLPMDWDTAFRGLPFRMTCPGSTKSAQRSGGVVRYHEIGKLEKRGHESVR
jgi:hypothetical protein